MTIAATSPLSTSSSSLAFESTITTPDLFFWGDRRGHDVDEDEDSDNNSDNSDNNPSQGNHDNAATPIKNKRGFQDPLQSPSSGDYKARSNPIRVVVRIRQPRPEDASPKAIALYPISDDTSSCQGSQDPANNTSTEETTSGGGGANSSSNASFDSKAATGMPTVAPQRRGRGILSKISNFRRSPQVQTTTHATGSNLMSLSPAPSHKQGRLSSNSRSSSTAVCYNALFDNRSNRRDDEDGDETDASDEPDVDDLVEVLTDTTPLVANTTNEMSRNQYFASHTLLGSPPSHPTHDNSFDVNADAATDGDFFGTATCASSRVPTSLLIEATKMDSAEPFPHDDNNDGRTTKTKQRQFEVDAVMASMSTPEIVYQSTFGDTVQRTVFRGYNLSVVAYGSGLSGKAYTMEGPLASANGGRRPKHLHRLLGNRRNIGESEAGGLLVDTHSLQLSHEDGIVIRTVHDLFRCVHTYTAAMAHVTIEMSCFEIVDDEVRDLLGSTDMVVPPRTPLHRRLKDLSRTATAEDDILDRVLCVPVGTLREAIEKLDQATKCRAASKQRVGQRSHVVQKFVVSVKPMRNNQSYVAPKETIASLTLVDIAGTWSTERWRETASSNSKDMEAIENLVSDLSSPSELSSPSKSSQNRALYNSCKVTQLLRDALGGNSFTVFIACVSPSLNQVEDSMRTLKLAEKMRGITNTVRKNVLDLPMSPGECAAMRAENKQLKTRVSKLNKRLKTATTNKPASEQPKKEAHKKSKESSLPPTRHNFSSLQTKIRAAEQEARAVRDNTTTLAATAETFRDRYESRMERSCKARSTTDTACCVARELSFNESNENGNDLVSDDSSLSKNLTKCSELGVKESGCREGLFKENISDLSSQKTSLENELALLSKAISARRIEFDQLEQEMQRRNPIFPQKERSEMHSETGDLDSHSTFPVISSDYDGDDSKSELEMGGIRCTRDLDDKREVAEEKKDEISCFSDLVSQLHMERGRREQAEARCQHLEIELESVIKAGDKLRVEVEMLQVRLCAVRNDEVVETTSPGPKSEKVFDFDNIEATTAADVVQPEETQPSDSAKESLEDSSSSPQMEQSPELKLSDITADVSDESRPSEQSNHADAVGSTPPGPEITTCVPIQDKSRPLAQDATISSGTGSPVSSGTGSPEETESPEEDADDFVDARSGLEEHETKATGDSSDQVTDLVESNHPEREGADDYVESNPPEEVKATDRCLDVESTAQLPPSKSVFVKSSLEGSVADQSSSTVEQGGGSETMSTTQSSAVESKNEDTNERNDENASLSSSLGTPPVTVEAAKIKRKKEPKVLVDETRGIEIVQQASSGSSARAEQDEIRSHAEKMLDWAGVAIEQQRRGSASSSVCSSMMSSIGTEFNPTMGKDNIKSSSSATPPLPPPLPPPSSSSSSKQMMICRPTANNTPAATNTHTQPPPLPPSRGRPPKFPLKECIGVSSQPQVIISNIDQMDQVDEPCTCESSMFTGHVGHVEFFLPKLGITCSCGKRTTTHVIKGGDPCHLTNILRDWQVDFLSSLGIHDAQTFVNACNQRSSILAKLMRRWRKQKRMIPVKTGSCSIALHIWNRTCKSVIATVKEQKARGIQNIIERPSFLQVNLQAASDTRTVSTLGFGSTK